MENPEQIATHKMWKEIIKKGKLGTVLLRNDLIKAFPYFVTGILAELLVISAVSRFDLDGVIYTGYSSHFKEVEPGDEPPIYNMNIINSKLKMGKDEMNYGPVDWSIDETPKDART